MRLKLFWTSSEVQVSVELLHVFLSIKLYDVIMGWQLYLLPFDGFAMALEQPFHSIIEVKPSSGSLYSDGKASLYGLGGMLIVPGDAMAGVKYVEPTPSSKILSTMLHTSPLPGPLRTDMTMALSPKRLHICRYSLANGINSSMDDTVFNISWASCPYCAPANQTPNVIEAPCSEPQDTSNQLWW